MDATPIIDRDRQARASEYARLRRRIMLVNLLVSATLVLIAIWLNPFRFLVPDTMADNRYLALGFYFVALLLLYRLILFPLSVYGGYILPKRYGLLTQSPSDWLKDVLKGTLLSLGFGMIVIQTVYFLLATFPQWWWLLAAVVMLLFTVVLANLAPVLLVPLFYKLERLEDDDLTQRLERLATRAGARVRGVYRMDMSRRTTAANAALMGLGNTRRIVLGDTLLAHYPPDEIETVLAHELGHHVNGDITKGIAVQSLVVLASFWVADRALNWGVTYFGFASAADPAGLPLLGAVLGVVSFLTMPVGNGLTRLMEEQADRYALESTDNPRAFAAAMTRLANQNLAEVDPPRWVEVLLYDHPPIGKRLARAEAYAQAQR